MTDFAKRNVLYQSAISTGLIVMTTVILDVQTADLGMGLVMRTVI